MSSHKKNQKRHQIIDLHHDDDEDDLAREIMQVERGDYDEDEDYDQLAVEGVPEDEGLEMHSDA